MLQLVSTIHDITLEVHLQGNVDYNYFVSICSIIMMPLFHSDFLDTHIYLTRGWHDSQAFAIMLQEGDDRDAITGLQAKTHFGRPDWNKEFDSISQAHPKYVNAHHVVFSIVKQIYTRLIKLVFTK